MARLFLGNVKGPKGDTGAKGAQGIQGPQGPAGPTGAVDKDTAIIFSQAAERKNIASGESIATVFGKIMKFFADLKTVAFSGKYTDLTDVPTALKNPKALTFTGGVTGSYDGSAAKSVAIPSGTDNLLATVAGTWLDAKQGKILDDKINAINSNFNNYVYPPVGSGDANNIKTNFHKFVFNLSNLPEVYGFLDVSHFSGSGFSPSSSGVIRQHFTGWNSGKEYTRCFYGNTWTPWVSANYKSKSIRFTFKSATEMRAEVNATGIVPIALAISDAEGTPYTYITSTAIMVIGSKAICQALSGGGFIKEHTLVGTLYYL